MKKSTIIFKSILFVLLLIFLFFCIFVRIKFYNVTFDQLIFSMTTSKNANYQIVFEGAIFISFLLLISLILVFLFYVIINYFKKKNSKSFINKINFNGKYVLICFSIFTIVISLLLLNFDSYIKYNLISSNFIENNYVDPRDVNIKFPDKKKNLIYIYSESLESSFVSTDNGGFVKKSYVPNLEKIGLENINFSHNDKLGGAYQLSNTTWTIAALVAHTSGLPLKLPIDFNAYKGYGAFLPGAYSLGDILKDNGYNNYFMIGSDADIGGRKDYFNYHGNYEIYDYFYAINDRFIPKDYYVWWGYEDKKLFEYAKKKLLEIDKNDEPFNFTLLTVDTHFTDGYVDSSCENKFDSKYANSFLCSDAKIYNFIEWIKKQDFYKDTTIIVSGDHLTMQKDFIDKNNKERNIYNIFINSSIEPISEKNRLFSTFDMFPTTLAAIGATIENDKLGLGVNLFSDKKTLLEKYGFDYVNDELLKKSNYYNNVLLGNTYDKMKKTTDSQ